MRLQTLILALLLLCPTLIAQEGDVATPGPAKEVAAFDKLLGSWKGQGDVYMMPNTPAMKWTGTSTNEKVLNGHFVQEDLRIEFHGDHAPLPIAFRTLYGFDREKKRWMAWSISNFGTVEKKQIHWVDGKMMYGGSKTERNPMTAEPEFVVERWSTTFGEDSYKLASYRTVGNGKPLPYVTGTFQKSQIADASFQLNKVGASVPDSKQMAPLAKFAGRYRVKGWMMMAPGAPRTEISATDEIATIFGGSVLEFRLKADPIPNMGNYEGYGVWVWNELDQCYNSFWADNMGQAAMMDTHFQDGKLLSGYAGTSMGQLIVAHQVLELNDDGSPKSITEHKSIGTAAPTKMFYATYEKK